MTSLVGQFPPGSKLDALVAEHVMGWSERVEIAPGRSLKSAQKWAAENGWKPGFLAAVQLKDRNSHYSGIPRIIHWTSDGLKLSWDASDVYEPPRYSTGIRQAWNVVEKLGLALVPQSMDDEFHWLAMDLEYVSYDDGVTLSERGEAYCSAETAPHAICIAALISVGYIDAWGET